MVGAAFPIDSVPGLAVTTDFRFFGTPVNKFTTSVSTITPARQIASGDVKADNFNYALTVGLRYNFGRVPPPPPSVVAPAPAPAPARTYLVFFDWDRADLTARAREIIAEAAQNAGRVQTTRIEVAGHADRSGTPAYNQRLSQRRADAVAAELVARGITGTRSRQRLWREPAAGADRRRRARAAEPPRRDRPALKPRAHASSAHDCVSCGPPLRHTHQDLGWIEVNLGREWDGSRHPSR